MTKGDRDKIRAEIAGRVAQGLVVNPDMIAPWDTRSYRCDAVSKSVHNSLAYAAVSLADRIMDRLGLSEEAEQAEIQREAERRRGGVS